jgi:hypothetical protein
MVASSSPPGAVAAATGNASIATTALPQRLYDDKLMIDDDHVEYDSAEAADDEARRLKSLAGAFVAGGATIGVFMVVIRLRTASNQGYISLDSEDAAE